MSRVGSDDRSEPAPAGEARARESVGGTFGTSLLLLITIGALASVFATAAQLARGGGIDGTARAAEVFRDATAPFGLDVVEASRSAQGDVVVRLARPATAPDDDAPEVDAPIDRFTGDEFTIDEFTDDESAASDPDEIVLVETAEPARAFALFRGGSAGPQGFGPPQDGDSARAASARLMSWQKDPNEAWHTLLKGADVSWSRWKADYTIERSFRVGGTWRDSARLNLIQPADPKTRRAGRNLIVFAQWPVGVAADEEGVRRVARSVRMLGADG